MNRNLISSLVLFVILALGSFQPVQGQVQVLAIDLETILELGGANNLTIQEYKLNQATAVADLEKAREWWLPELYAGTALHQRWGNAMNGDGRFFNSVNRQSFWGGVGVNGSWDFAEGIYKVDASELRIQAAGYQTEAQKNRILLEMVDAYYDFLSAQLYYKSYQNLAAQSDTIVAQIAVQVEAGLRYETELLLAQSNIQHLKIEMLKARRESNLKTAALVSLLNLPPGSKLIGTDTLLAPIDLVSLKDMSLSFEQAWENRPEYKGMNLMQQAMEREKKTVTTGLFIPELNVNTYAAFFGDAFSGQRPTSEINAQLIWRIPLGRLTNGGVLKQYEARMALHQNQVAQLKTQVNQEVMVAREQIGLAKEQMEIAVEGSRLARKALTQSLQRQQLGTVRPFEIMQAQEIYIQSRLDYLQAVADHNKAQYFYTVGIGNGL